MIDLEKALSRLREDAGANLRAIEELTKFRSRAKFFFARADGAEHFAYLLLSGHPSTAGKPPTVILGGHVKSASQLVQHLPKEPYTIVETPRTFFNSS